MASLATTEVASPPPETATLTLLEAASAATLTVTTMESLAPGFKGADSTHTSVPTLQTQLPLASVMVSAVRPAGRVTVVVSVLLAAVCEPVFETLIVPCRSRRSA